MNSRSRISDKTARHASKNLRGRGMSDSEMSLPPSPTGARGSLRMDRDSEYQDWAPVPWGQIRVGDGDGDGDRGVRAPELGHRGLGLQVGPPRLTCHNAPQALVVASKVTRKFRRISTRVSQTFRMLLSARGALRRPKPPRAARRPQLRRLARALAAAAARSSVPPKQHKQNMPLASQVATGGTHAGCPPKGARNRTTDLRSIRRRCTAARRATGMSSTQ
jgi:hypothetical protein